VALETILEQPVDCRPALRRRQIEPGVVPLAIIEVRRQLHVPDIRAIRPGNELSQRETVGAHTVRGAHDERSLTALAPTRRHVKRASAAGRAPRKRKRHPRDRRAAEHRYDPIANRSETKPVLVQDNRGDAAVFPQKTQEQMLCSDMTVEEPIGFLSGVLEDLPGLVAEGHIGRFRRDGTPCGTRLDLAPDLLDREPARGEDARNGGLFLTQQSEQHVLGLHEGAAKLKCFVASEEERAPRLFCI
jgi:hypothetical protein